MPLAQLGRELKSPSPLPPLIDPTLWLMVCTCDSRRKPAVIMLTPA